MKRQACWQEFSWLICSDMQWYAMTKTSSSQIVQLQRQWWIPGKPSRCCCSFYEPWLDKGNIRLAVPPKYSKPTPFFYNKGVVKNSHPFSTVHNNHRWITFFPPHISKRFLSFLAAFQEMLPPRSFEVLEWWCSQALFITWKGGTANVTSLSGIMEGCVQSSLSENLNRKVRKVTALRPGVFGCQDPWFPLVYIRIPWSIFMGKKIGKWWSRIKMDQA